MAKIKYTTLVLFYFISTVLFSQSSKKRSGNGNRIYIGPTLNFYTLNKNHAINPSQKASALFGFKREQNLGRDYKTFLLIGIDYFFHGLNFRSYYFEPAALKLYDRSFAYNYSLFIHELNLPVQVKYLFKRGDNSLFSSYILAGYHLRYLLPGTVKITQNGTKIKDDVPDLKFKNALLNDKCNAFVSLGFGWQKNSLSSSKGSFFAELNCKYGFSGYSFTADYAASSLYINGVHLSLQLGTKF
jgi:hypothetical protein